MTSFQGHSATKAQVDELFQILSIMRPHGSKTEAKFIEEFIKPLNPTVDGIGNQIVRIGDAPIMWSCHIDTVHNYGGIAPLKVDDKGIITVHDRSMANCLGADDGAGIWLMKQMILAERPGLYVFHRGEERGGIGSKWLAKNTPKVLDGIEAAIAFDRKDTESIITHQFGGRCCSEVFANSLSDAIGLGMKSDSGGSFTDTASYTDLVGECTNVSVGYKWQHSRTEFQDMPFLLKLLDHMLQVDTRDLKFKRKPGEKEPTRYYGGRRTDDFGYGYYGYGGDYRSDEYYSGRSTHNSQTKTHDKSASKKDKKPNLTVVEKKKRQFIDTGKYEIMRIRKWGGTRPDSHLQLVMDYPEEIAALLKDKQFGLEYLHNEIRKRGGDIKTGYRLKPN